MPPTSSSSSSPSPFQLVQPSNNARSFINLGGVENSVENKPNVFGDNNNVNIGLDPSTKGQQTLIGKATHEVGRILEGGADLVTAPAKWLGHMQENCNAADDRKKVGLIVNY